MTPIQIRLVHWHPIEASERASRLSSLGYSVNFEPLTPAATRALRQAPPAAVVIDLSRLPSQGRDVALQIRQMKPMRQVPLVFVGGDPEKLGRIRELLPDAVYTTWDMIEIDLQDALANPPQVVVVPESNFAAYAGVPLIQKLGIKPSSAVALVGAPPDFGRTLGDLPAGARLLEGTSQPCDLLVWFVRSFQELQEGVEAIRARVGKDGLWVVWPKKASGMAGDLSQEAVRKTVMAAGLVDYKISSIDATWSGLRFALRPAREKG